MIKDITVTCPMCRRTIPISDIRVHEKNRICGNCYSRIKGGKILPDNEELKHQPREHKNEVSYVCSSCNYKFSRPVGFEREHLCPFCGKRETIQRQATSQDILSSVSDSPDILDDEEYFLRKKRAGF